MRGALVRRRIVRQVEGDPGVSQARLCRSVGLSQAALEQHLRVLERRGQVQLGGGRRRGVFPGFEELWILRALHDDVPAQLVDRLRVAPGARVGELSQALGVPRSVVRRHLRALDGQGRIRSTGLRRRYHVDGRRRGRAGQAERATVAET